MPPQSETLEPKIGVLTSNIEARKTLSQTLGKTMHKSCRSQVKPMWGCEAPAHPYQQVGVKHFSLRRGYKTQHALGGPSTALNEHSAG